MKNNLNIQLSASAVLCLFFILAVAPGIAHAETRNDVSFECTVDFSSPVLKDRGQFVDVAVTEANSVTTTDGSPMMPVFSKTFEFPWGTTIQSVDIQPSLIQTMSTGKQVKPVPVQQKIGNDIVPSERVIDQNVYSSARPYPSTWYTYTTGAGLNSKNEHVIFLTCHLTPVQYLPSNQVLQYSNRFTIQIKYTLPIAALKPATTYPLVIIAPAEFSQLLQPLVDHKNNHSVPTKLVTLEEIYNTFSGRDNPEKIKYFIKSAIEDWGATYILLVGDITKLPIRETYGSEWEDNLLSDQYYADIYDASEHFCTWDKNGNNRFGEVNHQGYDIDGVDLFADVNVGRLACTDATEVTTVVSKIITYEDETTNQIWFKRIVLAGGDTFPLYRGAPPFVYEGEITNTKVGQTLPDFTQTYLWTSKHNLRAATFNRAINQGAGFVTYAGHGFEHGWGTYRPNALTDTMILYYIPFINKLTNGDKLPIMFFDACLTAKLDFNVSSLQHYYPKIANLLVRLFGLSSNPSDNYECFAWDFIAKENGGAIATVGATRSAYTWVDANGVYGGAGYLDVHFFASYSNGVTAGQMMTGAQNAYIQGVGYDYFTIEEFLLLGDPSLMVGGYQ
jgi:hypothetical protein